MLTVLIQHLDDTKRQVLFEVNSVEYQSEGEAAGLLLVIPDGTGKHLSRAAAGHDRDVFVMNSAGKTVARYIL